MVVVALRSNNSWRSAERECCQVISQGLFSSGTNHSQNFEVKHKMVAPLIHQEMNGCYHLPLSGNYIQCQGKHNSLTTIRYRNELETLQPAKQMLLCLQSLCKHWFWHSFFILCAYMSPNLMTGNWEITGKYDALFCGSFASLLSACTKQVLKQSRCCFPQLPPTKSLPYIELKIQTDRVAGL